MRGNEPESGTSTLILFGASLNIAKLVIKVPAARRRQRALQEHRCMIGIIYCLEPWKVSGYFPLSGIGHEANKNEEEDYLTYQMKAVNPDEETRVPKGRVFRHTI
jgi:hypothetical protein